MSKLAKALTAAAGNAGESLYVEDVFSTYLYTGTGSPLSITNGIDLAGEGGLVWGKSRTSGVFDHQLMDTERGIRNVIVSNKTDAEASNGDISAFNSDGFSLSTGNNLMLSNGQNFASWTFRKAEKFFDVVTYTGDGTAGHTISHNLGAVPAVIIVKRLDGTGNWAVYHKDADATSPEDKYLFLNSTAAVADAPVWNDYAPTDTDFQVGSYPVVNNSGSPFVAYLFASDAGGFGDDGSESIIKCGSYVGTGVTGSDVTVGFEPQWIMIKETDSASYNIDWWIWDNLRGFDVNGDGPYLRANGSNAESTASGLALRPTATGFKLGNDVNTNASGVTYIYIAIRRPMKTPESGTEVFDVDFGNNVTSSGDKVFPSSITVDALLYLLPSGGGQYFYDRMRGGQKVLQTSSTAAETSGGFPQFDTQTGVNSSTVFNFSSRVGAAFKRATGFFDVVAYTGDGTAHAEDHNLGVTPELLIVKNRSSVRNWFVWVDGFGSTDYLELNLSSAKQTGANIWNSTTPTASQFSVGGVNNTSGNNFIAYLFATLAGVSKVGSYTGSNNVGPQTIDCGFSTGARFVLIKNTGIGEWFVFDVERGITVGSTDGVLQLQSTSQEYTEAAWGGGDMIQPHPSGFTLTTNGQLNSYTSTYIFLAIA